MNTPPVPPPLMLIPTEISVPMFPWHIHAKINSLTQTPPDPAPTLTGFAAISQTLQSSAATNPNVGAMLAELKTLASSLVETPLVPGLDTAVSATISIVYYCPTLPSILYKTTNNDAGAKNDVWNADVCQFEPRHIAPSGVTYLRRGTSAFTFLDARPFLDWVYHFTFSVTGALKNFMPTPQAWNVLQTLTDPGVSIALKEVKMALRTAHGLFSPCLNNTWNNGSICAGVMNLPAAQITKTAGLIPACSAWLQTLWNQPPNKDLARSYTQEFYNSFVQTRDMTWTTNPTKLQALMPTLESYPMPPSIISLPATMTLPPLLPLPLPHS